VVELAELIGELRTELEKATEAAQDATLRFELGPVEVEVLVIVTREGGASGKIRFWIAEVGGDARLSESSTQRIKLNLVPRRVGSSDPPWVSDEATTAER
jgi:hypothetical protein